VDSNALWIVVLSIATPIAGVVGFAIQLRQVKKAHLENEKLKLEIDALKRKAKEAERRIVQVTTAEVQKFSPRDRILFSRSASSGNTLPVSKQKTNFKEAALAAIIVAGLLLFAGYLCYDLYRLFMWGIAKF
jgi:hypothetical protein